MTLRDVQRDASAFYKCEVSADLPFFHTVIKSAPMIVAGERISNEPDALFIKSSLIYVLIKAIRGAHDVGLMQVLLFIFLTNVL